MANSLLGQYFMPGGSEDLPKPQAIVATATITPNAFLLVITGTTALVTITPPLPGVHMLAIIGATTNWLGATSAGNILPASITNGTSWTNKVSFLVYNPLTGKYHASWALGNTTDT